MRAIVFAFYVAAAVDNGSNACATGATGGRDTSLNYHVSLTDALVRSVVTVMATQRRVTLDLCRTRDVWTCRHKRIDRDQHIAYTKDRYPPVRGLTQRVTVE